MTVTASLVVPKASQRLYFFRELNKEFLSRMESIQWGYVTQFLLELATGHRALRVGSSEVKT